MKWASMERLQFSLGVLQLFAMAVEHITWTAAIQFSGILPIK